jgi:hypothetical protein
MSEQECEACGDPIPEGEDEYIDGKGPYCYHCWKKRRTD